MPITLSTGSGKRHAITSDASEAHRLQLYESPPCAVHALLAVEGHTLGQVVWECSAGPGVIVRILRETGRKVIATDLVDWGCPDSESGRDFLLEQEAPAGVTSICSNPPFNLADEFAAHAIKLCPRVCLLMRGAFLEGMRWYMPEENPRGLGLRAHLARVWMFAPRLPFMHRHGYEGPRNSNSGMPFAWFVFERDAARYSAAQIRWINPRDYEPKVQTEAKRDGAVAHVDERQEEFAWDA